MSRITQSHRERMLEVIEEIRDRSNVYLEGKDNGKTRILQELREVSLVRDANGKVIARRPHAESSDIEFISGIHWPVRDIATLKVVRQIVAQCGRGYKREIHQVNMAFNGLLHDYHDQGKILCVVVDNAELLSAKCFDIMKELNELRDPKRRRQIGLTFVFAGQFARMRAPMSFLNKCASVRVSRITKVEITELLQTSFPLYASSFDDKSVRRLAILESTGKIHKAARQAVMIMRRDRAKIISPSILEEALAA
jgi:hypothetical protein